MKAKLLMFLAVAVFVFSSVMVVQAETETSIWREEMNYQSLDQLKLQAGQSLMKMALAFLVAP